MFQGHGQRVMALCQHMGHFSFFCVDTFLWMLFAPWRGQPIRWLHVLNQMVYIGVKSVLIVGVVNGFMGMIMAMQTAYILKKFGALMYTGSLLGISFLREVGPLLAAIVIAGRVGSAMAAELGAMKVSEEIDALEVMGINPVRFLIVPRILAILLMLPCLTLVANMCGILGGFIIGVGSLHLEPALYMARTFDMLVHKDLLTGLVKSGCFGLIIGMVGCYQGFSVEGGAEGVGKATTMSVIVSIILIVLADAFFTAFFYFLF